FGLAWYNPLTWGIGGAKEGDIQRIKDNYCSMLKRLRCEGKITEEQYKRMSAAAHCGQSVSFEISNAALTGFGQGAYDGFLVTTNRAARAFSFGLLGYTRDQLAQNGDLYDNDNPYLIVSQWAGLAAGIALQIAAFEAGAGWIGSRLPVYHFTTPANA